MRVIKFCIDRTLIPFPVPEAQHARKSIYAMLRGIKGISRVFYRIDINWVHPPPSDPWRQLRLVVFLNHASLYEPLFVGGFPPDTIR